MRASTGAVSVEVNDLNSSPRFHDRHLDQIPSYPCAKLKLDQFFLQWLAEHQDVVNGLVEDVQLGRTIRGPSQQLGPSPLSPSTSHSMFHGTTPPLSPSKQIRSPGTPSSPRPRPLQSTLSRVSRRPTRAAAHTRGSIACALHTRDALSTGDGNADTGSEASGASLAPFDTFPTPDPWTVTLPVTTSPPAPRTPPPCTLSDAFHPTAHSSARIPSWPVVTTIPRFYFPTASPPDTARAQFLSRVDAHYAASEGELLQTEAVQLMQGEACQLPGMVSHALFRRLAGSAAGCGLGKEVFTGWWLGRGLVGATPARKVFEVLRSEGQQYLTPADWAPVLECILAYHPGLEFLQGSAEFQKKYAETAIIRIFYSANRSGSSKLSFRELRKCSDVIDALYRLDSEEDINKVLRFFSYEHFYVIYCKFWELDTDHDFLIDKTDLAHYSQCALSFQIIDRIFDQVRRGAEKRPPRRFSSQSPKMGYEDFVWFILSEEDKTTDTALEYWFRCADLDGDGSVRPREMWHFYEEQLKRLEGLSQEPVLFEDVLCQVHDMLQPAVEGAYTLKDLHRTRPQSGLFFNALFNLHKFLAWENRDPFAMRAEAGEFLGCGEWDKFAKVEYYRCGPVPACPGEGRGGAGGSLGGSYQAARMLASEDEGGEEVAIDADEAAVWPEVDEAMLDGLQGK
ncbi:MAG: hypothetical protein WDW36_009408 [Sanguina aurantia]